MDGHTGQRPTHICVVSAGTSIQAEHEAWLTTGEPCILCDLRITNILGFTFVKEA